MAPSVHQRSPRRRHSSDRSLSPVHSRSSPHRRTSRRRERSPQRRGSPRARSPARVRSSHSMRSPTRGKVSSHGRSPQEARSKSSVSRSPSPRSKRLRRVQAERLVDKQTERNSGMDDDRGHRERGRDKEPGERKRDRDGDSRPRRGSSKSPTEHAHSHRSRYESSSPQGSRASKAEKYEEGKKDDSVAKMKAVEEALETKQKQKPSFELSGKLAEETNRVRGVTLLFTEPPDARKPNVRWRLYVFKAGEALNDPLYIHRQSCYLFGRERRVADIPTDHPSCSKQHALIQYRYVEKEQPDGTVSKQVRPYLMDLGSTNGTFMNDNRIDPQRYYELIEKDTIKFGNTESTSCCTRTLYHENRDGTSVRHRFYLDQKDMPSLSSYS
ncbi:FHA domain-containing protein DDL-like isoform X2 [Aristolochia californica]|uniref:FHA domain-containing protein DDL-like isoform X2 n=1 Tax=Aristolochia californica TaxID=171875 RepID=UPI0035DBC254